MHTIPAELVTGQLRLQHMTLRPAGGHLPACCSSSTYPSTPLRHQGNPLRLNACPPSQLFGGVEAMILEHETSGTGDNQTTTTHRRMRQSCLVEVRHAS